MGLSSSSLSVLTLDLSDAGNSGRTSSSAQMAATMSIATALAVSGTLLATLLTAGRVRRVDSV
ncbi:hypothetical protein ACWCOV_15045 [Kribbella sp. NPDC002412]